MNEVRRRVAGLVLAAGASRRMGFCKQALRFEGTTLVQRAVDALIGGGVAPVVVVVHRECPPPRGYRSLLRVVDAPEGGTAGPAETLQLGLEALEDTHDALVVTLSDLPGQTDGLVRQVIDEFRATGAPVVLPRPHARPGHPVLFRWDVVAELRTLAPCDRPLRIVQAHDGEVVFIDLDDERLIGDIDTPDEAKAWGL